MADISRCLCLHVIIKMSDFPGTGSLGPTTGPARGSHVPLVRCIAMAVPLQCRFLNSFH